MVTNDTEGLVKIPKISGLPSKGNGLPSAPHGRSQRSLRAPPRMIAASLAPRSLRKKRPESDCEKMPAGDCGANRRAQVHVFHKSKS